MSLSKIIRLYRKFNFTSKHFRANAKDLTMELKFSGMESEISIGKSEGYHHPLWQTFSVLSSKQFLDVF